jgi:DNA helicase II / ATP-dependent DNA helicase PcrA
MGTGDSSATRGAIAALGRGVVVSRGQPAPAGWGDAPRVTIDETTLARPDAALDELQRAWGERRPVVVELSVDAAALRAPEIDDRPPYELPPTFELQRERLAFLASANNYDGRGPELAWWPTWKAIRLGARLPDPDDPGVPAGSCDVVLADGTAVWCDGGPRGPIAWTEASLRRPILHRVNLEDDSTRVDRDEQQEPDGDRTPPSSASGSPSSPTARPRSTLAPDQLEAVLHPAGAARIIAPAGSGKTTVLTARLRHLLVDRGWDARHVSALAFNVRAKDEMQARLGDLPETARRKVRTVHSLGWEVLRRSRRGLEVVDERTVRTIVDDVFAPPHRANADPAAAYLEALSAVRLGLRDPASVEAASDELDGFTAGFDRYREILAERSWVDHDEQIYGAVEALLRDPALRRQVQRECRHLLVDEFQDLTPAQLLLVRLVAAPAYDVFGVGDDDQVIYGYAGADPDFLVRYGHYFPGADSHPLQVNYRCPAPVVAAAVSLLSHNLTRVPKEIRSGAALHQPGHRGDLAEAGASGSHEPGQPLQIERRPSAELAPAAVDRAAAWIADGTDPGEIAVLTRVRSWMLPAYVLLVDRAIPVRAKGLHESILERTGVRAVFAYLRITNAIANGATFSGRDVSDTIRRPPRRISRPIMDRVTRRSWTRATLASEADRLTGSDGPRLSDYVADLDLLAGMARRGADAAELITEIRDTIGLGRVLSTLDLSGKGSDASHLDDLNALLAIAAAQPDPSVLEAHVRGRLRHLGEHPLDADESAVTLSTVHTVKGMEWDRVVVLGAHDGLLPHTLADDVEEERRIFHVAITRCRREVVVLADADAAAPFLHELLHARDPLAATPVPVSARVSARAPAAKTPDRARAGRAKPATGAVPVYLQGRDQGADRIWDGLRAWRSATAIRLKRPAYTVLQDKSLDEIAARRPVTLDDLARCYGIGSSKLENFGDEILAVVAESGETETETSTDAGTATDREAVLEGDGGSSSPKGA